MLTNRSLHDPTSDKSWNQATLSIYLDNWSPHSLKLAGDEIRSGTFSKGLMPHDVTSYNRDLALRSLSSKETQKTSGMVSWTVTEKNTNKLAVFTLGWDVGNGIESKFSVRLGLDEPSYESLWQKSKNNRMASTNQLDNTIYVGGLASLRFVAAANMTMNDGDTTHYRLRVSFVPANIDVWGWVKYYSVSAGRLNHFNSKREPFEAAQQQEKEKQLQEAAKKVADKTPEKKPSKIVPKKKPDSLDEKNPQESRFEQKHLLDNDTELAYLHKANLTLRKALAYLDASIAVGLLVENWSAYPLSKPTIEIQEGKVLQENTSIPVPGSVKAGTMNAGIILQSKALTGTNGVIRWTVGSADLVLSLMWVVPYNRQFYRSWVAVGITSHTNLPTYKEMYSGKDDSRFTRRNAGQKFEFSTAGGKFILIAEMDGDSTLKPVLRVSLIPKDESLLGSNIRTRLGMKPSILKNDPLESDFNYQKTQQHKSNNRQEKLQDDMPSVGLVQSTTGFSSTSRTFLSSVLIILCNTCVILFCSSILF